MRGTSMTYAGGGDREISTDPVTYTEPANRRTGLDWSKHSAPTPEPERPTIVTAATETRPDSGTYVDAIAVAHIKVDRSYQRPLDNNRIARMAAEFNPSLVGVIEVSMRIDGYYYVVDGQHRLELVRKVKGKTAAIAANVHTGLTPADEAQLFFDIDRKRKRLTGWDRWYARRGAGEQIVHDIETIAAKHGLRIDPAPKVNHLRCVSSCEKIVELNGLDLLDQTLKICVAAYSGEPDSLRAEIVHGVALILAFHKPDVVDTDRLVAGMQSIAARQISARAASLREAHTGVLPRLAAHVIVDEYNKQPGPKLTPFLKAFTTGRKDRDLVAVTVTGFTKASPPPYVQRRTTWMTSSWNGSCRAASTRLSHARPPRPNALPPPRGGVMQAAHCPSSDA